MTNQVTTRITREQHKVLNRIKDETGIPVAESVQRAVDVYIEKYKGIKRDDPFWYIFFGESEGEE